MSDPISGPNTGAPNLNKTPQPISAPSEDGPPAKKAKLSEATTSLGPVVKDISASDSSRAPSSTAAASTPASAAPPFPKLPSDTVVPDDDSSPGTVPKPTLSNKPLTVLAASAVSAKPVVAGDGISAKARAPTASVSVVTASPVGTQNASGSTATTSSESGNSSKESLSSSAAAAAPAERQTPAAVASKPSTSTSAKPAPLQPKAGTHAPLPKAAAAPPSQTPSAVPLKATTMTHLRSKYTGELEYMLREFRKLERQLLGANRAPGKEQPESRERREKLHSFILHLEDTLSQIELGCKLEAEGKTTVHVGVTQEDGAAMSSSSGATASKSTSIAEAGALHENLTQEKEEEENVQKLEEHILANLLPVKVRLKKQLAAQQGATKNPAGMPAPRRGSWQPSAAADRGKGTFAAAAEQKRKAAEEARLAEEEKERIARRINDPTQFGKPLSGGGSSLTKKLHGSTLGSKARTHGHGVGGSARDDGPDSDLNSGTSSDRKILYGGMVPQSKQHSTGVAAASGAHEMVVSHPAFKKKSPPEYAKPPTKVGQERSKPKAASSAKETSKLTAHEQERLTLKKNRRKRKLLKLARRREKERQRHMIMQQQAAQAAQAPPRPTAGRKKMITIKSQGKKKGPRAVEYICALCSETYGSTCDYNPWWAVVQHECPKCRKSQIPRIDISAPANAIEYHPALLAHVDEPGNGGGGSSNPPPVPGGNPPASSVPPPTVATKGPPPSAAASSVPSAVPAPPVMSQKYPPLLDDFDSDSDLSELSDDSLSDCSLDSDDSCADIDAMTPVEQAEYETFGAEYKGPVLPDEDAAKLLVLMCHASTCPCNHKNEKARDVCQSTKYMMLHIRDCPGTTSTYDVCPFPWCRKAKHLLYHLVSCRKPKECAICSPKSLPKGFSTLVGLNAHRFKKRREKMVAAIKAANSAARKSRPSSGQSKKSSGKSSQSRNSSVSAAARKTSQAKKATTSTTSKTGHNAAPKSGAATTSKAGSAAPPKSAPPPRKPVPDVKPEQPNMSDLMATAALAASASENSVSTTALAESIAAQMPHHLTGDMDVSIPGPDGVNKVEAATTKAHATSTAVLTSGTAAPPAASTTVPVTAATAENKTAPLKQDPVPKQVATNPAPPAPTASVKHPPAPTVPLPTAAANPASAPAQTTPTVPPVPIKKEERQINAPGQGTVAATKEVTTQPPASSAKKTEATSNTVQTATTKVDSDGDVKMESPPMPSEKRGSAADVVQVGG